MLESESLRFLDDDLTLKLDIWTAAWLGEKETIIKYLETDRRTNHPDEQNNPGKDK